jgi:hypothetical protein
VIYGCISGQLSLWLISFFGTTRSISQIGALGRLAVIFTLFASLFTILLVPRFSRMQNVKGPLLKRFLSIQVMAGLVGAVLLLFVWLLSNQLLWVLGKNYYGLNYELFLVGLSTAISMLGTLCSQLVVCRGWYINPYILIALNFLSTVLALTLFNVSSFVNLMYFNISISAVHYICMLVYGLVNISRARVGNQE